jgi:hypothetical protein
MEGGRNGGRITRGDEKGRGRRMREDAKEEREGGRGKGGRPNS